MFNQEYINDRKRKVGDYAADGSEPGQLLRLKLDVEKLLYLPRPFTRRQHWDIEVAKFKVAVYCAVDELFKNGLQNPRCQCIETDSILLSISTMHFVNHKFGEVPPEGIPRLLTRTSGEIRLTHTSVSVSVLDDQTNCVSLLDQLISKLRDVFVVQTTKIHELRGLIPLTEGEIEVQKRLAHFIRSEFRITERDYLGDRYVRVEFWYVTVDPISDPRIYSILTDLAEQSQRKREK